MTNDKQTSDVLIDEIIDKMRKEAVVNCNPEFQYFIKHKIPFITKNNLNCFVENLADSTFPFVYSLRFERFQNETVFIIHFNAKEGFVYEN